MSSITDDSAGSSMNLIHFDGGINMLMNNDNHNINETDVIGNNQLFIAGKMESESVSTIIMNAVTTTATNVSAAAVTAPTADSERNLAQVGLVVYKNVCFDFSTNFLPFTIYKIVKSGQT